MIRNKTKKIIICIMILFLLFLIKSCNCFAIKIVIDPGHGA
jgi:N-acetylmuramoyl-L-alanine amidase